MRLPIALAVAAGLLVSGCTQPLETKEGKKYDSYGLVNKSRFKSQHVCYHVPAGSIILGIIFVETIIVPVYIVGWDLYNPDRVKKDANDDCSVDYD